MKNNYAIISVFILSILLLCTMAHGQTDISTAQNGNWNAGSTWVGGVVPITSQNAIINHTVTLTADASINNLTVNSGGVVDASTFTLSASGVFTLNNGSEYRRGGTITDMPGTSRVFESNSTVVFNGTQTSITGNFTFGNLTWGSTGNATPGGDLTVNGTLWLLNCNQFRGSTGSSTPTRTHSIVGNVIVDGSNATLVGSNASAAGTGTWNIGGNVVIQNGGTLRGCNDVGNGTFNIGGDLTCQGSNDSIQINDGSAIGVFTVNFTGTGSNDLNPGINNAFEEVTIASGKTINLINNTMNVNGSSLVVNGLLDCGNMIIAGTGSFSLMPNATLMIGSSAGISSSSASGNIQVEGVRTFSTSANYIYDGLSPQVTGDGLPATINNLTINNINGVTLSSNYTINGLLTFTIGNLITGSNNVSISSSGSVSQTSGHVVGNLKKHITTGAVNRIFEIGTGSDYTPVEISFGNVTNAGDLTASTIASEHPNIVFAGINENKSVNRYYILENDGIVFDNYDATFYFVEGDIDIGADTNVFVVNKYDGVNWLSTTAGNRTSTSTQALDLTSFSDFAIGEPQTKYYLTINIIGGGTVDKDLDLPIYPIGTDVQLTAIPNPGYGFSSWSGDTSSTNNPITINMSSDKDVTATFTWNKSIVYVSNSGNDTTGDGTLSLPYRTINKGISEVLSSGTVNVLAGTYNEQVIIDKNLTLQGEDALTTFITAPANMIQAFYPDREEYQVIGVMPGRTVTVDGFTIDGQYRNHSYYAGIQYYKSSGVIKNNIVKKFQTNPLSGTIGLGILVHHLISETVVHTAEIYNNTVSEFSKNGITANGSGLTVDIHNNVVIGFGPTTVIAQNGIQLAFGAIGSIADNNISNLSYTGISWASSGMLISAAGGTPILYRDTLTNCQIGINVQDVSANMRENVINASEVGTGRTAFYNVELYRSTAASTKTSSNKIEIGRSLPYEDLVESNNQNLSSAPIISVTFNGNTLSGDGTRGYNLYALAEGTNGIILTADSNSFRDGYVGIVTDKDPGATLTTVFRHNKIFGNQYGMLDVTNVLQDARQNWWGHSTGPKDNKALPGIPNYNNPSGLGDTVSSYVDYKPWHIDEDLLYLSEYTITASTGPNGVISPSGEIIVPHDQNQSFTITPDPDYRVSDVLVDGSSVGAVTNYTFENVRSSHTIEASFTLITDYIIEASTGPNGSISPSGSVSVPLGNDLAFIISPDDGYFIDSVIVDNISVDSTTSYTFYNVHATHTIRIVFGMNNLTVSVEGDGSVSKVPNKPRYTYNESVQLTATPVRGWQFVGWSGDASGSANPLYVVMNRAKNIAATFDVSPAYQLTHRTAAYEDWATAVDGNCKYKSIKRKNNRVLLKFNFIAPGSATGFKLKFGMITTGTVYSGKDKSVEIGTVDSIKEKLFAGLTIAQGDTFQFDGMGWKGKIAKVRVEWSTSPRVTRVTITDYKNNDPLLPLPNLHNVGEEIFGYGQSSYFPTGLLVGIPLGDRKAYSVIHQKYKDVQKSMVKVVGGSPMLHNDSVKCIDRFPYNQRPIDKQQKSLPPDKYSNKLFAELLTLKMNVAASAVNKFPNGFGELTFDDPEDPENPFNGRMINDIIIIADSTISCLPIHAITPEPTALTFYEILRRLNEAFKGELDTISFTGKTMLAGVKRLIDVPFLCETPGVIPINIDLAPFIADAIPTGYELSQNYPNPFNPVTTIQFSLLNPSVVTLKIYDMLGREITTLIDRVVMDEGLQEVEFMVSGIASGVYFYRIAADEIADDEESILGNTFTSVKKMLLMK